MARGAIRVVSINGPLTVTFTAASGATPVVFSDEACTTTIALPATVADGASDTFFFASPGAYVLSVETAAGVQIAHDLNTTRIVAVYTGNVGVFSYDARLVAKDFSGDSGRHSPNVDLSAADNVRVSGTPANGDTIVYDSTSGLWVPGSGGTGAAILPLDVPPGTPSTWDDEFSATSLDAKWSNLTTNLTASTTVANHFATLEPATAGSASTGLRACGIRQTAPTGAFTVSAKIVQSQINDDTHAGLFVSDGTDATVFGDYMGVGVSSATQWGVIGSPYSETADWSTYDGYLTTAASNNQAGIKWVRLQWDGVSSYIMSFSADGVLWIPATTRTAVSQPTRIGLVLYSNSATLEADHQLACDWFRVTT